LIFPGKTDVHLQQKPVLIRISFLPREIQGKGLQENRGSNWIVQLQDMMLSTHLSVGTDLTAFHMCWCRKMGMERKEKMAFTSWTDTQNAWFGAKGYAKVLKHKAQCCCQYCQLLIGSHCSWRAWGDWRYKNIVSFKGPETTAVHCSLLGKRDNSLQVVNQISLLQSARTWFRHWKWLYKRVLYLTIKWEYTWKPQDSSQPNLQTSIRVEVLVETKHCLAM